MYNLSEHTCSECCSLFERAFLCWKAVIFRPQVFLLRMLSVQRAVQNFTGIILLEDDQSTRRENFPVQKKVHIFLARIEPNLLDLMCQGSVHRKYVPKYNQ